MYQNTKSENVFLFTSLQSSWWAIYSSDTTPSGKLSSVTFDFKLPPGVNRLSATYLLKFPQQSSTLPSQHTSQHFVFRQSRGVRPAELPGDPAVLHLGPRGPGHALLSRPEQRRGVSLAEGWQGDVL